MAVETKKYGSQKPRIDIYKAGDTEKAEYLFEIFEAYGIKLLPWQKTVLLRWLAEDEYGNFVNLECGLSVPRQNGKTEMLIFRIIYGILFRHAKGLYTAQQDDTANEVKKRVQKFFYESEHEEIFNLLTPRFRKKPENLDFIEFMNGASYKFKTRTRLGGLGVGYDDLIFDEAAEVLDQHQSTLLPTISSAKTGNPQVIYVGTPPMAESVGTVYPRVRKEKLAGGPGAWTEFGVEKFTDPKNKNAWYKANPSMGYFLLPSVVEVESGSMSADDFNRMRLGWWSGIEEKRAIAQKDWEELATEKPEFDDGYMPVYAVKFSPDRSDFSLVVSQPLSDGRIHVEVIMNRPISDGYVKLARWLIERWKNSAKIVIDGATGAPILLEELKSGGVPLKRIHQPSMKEVVAAHQFMRDAIDQAELSHYDQPLLNQVVRVTKERSFGRYGGFGWESMNKNITTSALDAATFALWGQKVFRKEKINTVDAEKNRQMWKDVLGGI